MEDDKKKKKNKKKKNKQATKPNESITLDARESTADSQSHVQEIGQNNNGQVSGIVDAPNDVRGHINADRDGHLANGTEVTNLAEAEKQYWLDRVATFEDKIKELQAEKNAQIQKEAFLEERIKQLMKEKDGNSEKEASQKEKIKQLHDEKNASLQNEARLKEKTIQLEKEKDALIKKEGSLEQRILQLQREMDAHVQKEANLETEILQLEGEKDSWVQKEAGFEVKINQLVDEAALLNLKAVSLEEKIKQMERERDSWILKENSARESIASLTYDNTKLRAQVIELEQSREILLNETQQLKEIISSLQLQINNIKMENKLTSEDGDANYQVEAACALVDKLIAENSELVEKVNELCTELDRRGVRTQHFFSAGSVPGAVTAQSADNADGPALTPDSTQSADIADGPALTPDSTQSADIADGPAFTPDLAVGVDYRHITAQASDSIAEAGKIMPISDSTQSLEDVMVKDQRNGELVNVNDGAPRVANSSEIIEADEIVQIPLDENEVKETNLEVAPNDEKIDVSLSDAPLIGAPFRLVSFVARYVSGADLVNKNTGKSG